MFRRNKKENKAKLEHKLYLARENPEPIFDLSDCGIRNVPTGIYSLCRVFLKESLHLEHNQLSSLSGGGNLKDLHVLRVLNLQDNLFATIPEQIEFLVNLLELNISDNHIKKLPSSLCNLKKLRLLDASNNVLKKLPENIGNLISLRKLNILGNTSLNHLPKSICCAQRLREIQVDTSNFIYPPANVAEMGTESIMKFICDDTGFTYVPPDNIEELSTSTDERDSSDVYEESMKAKIRKLEKIKEQKMQEFLEIERNNELLQRQEFELANAMKANREKLLTDLSEQQTKFDLELAKLQQIKDTERFRLIEQLQEVEQNADLAINQLLSLNKEPLVQLIEQERLEEERLLAAACKYNETFRKNDALKAMQELLEQETERFNNYDQSRSETARSILEQEMQLDTHLLDVLRNHGSQKAELVSQLQEDVELQKAIVGALLERADARSWSLVQQVRVVESQLAALTTIELDRRKLEMDEQVNDLAEKRCHLSMLLMDLLHQQGERRAQLLSTLKTMEEKNTMEDFWLRQYQQLIERMPTTITEAQKNMDPGLSQALLMSGVLHCLPFLAHLAQTEGNVLDITDDDIRDAGVTSSEDRKKILDAFKSYSKGRAIYSRDEGPSAPPLEEASAPHENIQNNECVVCMEIDCEVIFVPCGHMCCCVNCSDPLRDCPMCRGNIERKIRVYFN
ncbi:hypothetical protein ILUMI_09399 [Ignelater luminosus]|uniref:RING-type domain-containing protein n=1 Tax=Ignelater luminosus TaxID=2038154 RepID=A0A8K0D4C1_IGNLU|nr:hypothetical protein ILUMI_09399 [Ignelater luminosus]